MIVTHGFYYLAGPYSSPERTVMEARFRLHVQVQAEMMKLGLVVFSPIAMSHTAAWTYDLPKDAEFWKKHNQTFIARSNGIIRIVTDGTFDSLGTNSEVNFAKSIPLPVHDFVIWKSVPSVWGTTRPIELEYAA